MMELVVCGEVEGYDKMNDWCVSGEVRLAEIKMVVIAVEVVVVQVVVVM